MSAKFRFIERLLVFALIFIVLVIGAVSLWALVLRQPSAARPAFNQTRAENTEEDAVKMFTGIGRLRAPLQAGTRTAVISPVFPYNGDDSAFTEELAAHVRDFRTLTLEYFASLPADSPALFDEQTLKNVLLTRYNALIKLGQIGELYLTDYMIID